MKTEKLPPGRYHMAAVVDAKGRVGVEFVDLYTRAFMKTALAKKNMNKDPAPRRINASLRVALFEALTTDVAKATPKERKIYNNTY